MREQLTEDQEVQRTKERLEAILGKGYVVEIRGAHKWGDVYRNIEVQKKTLFGGTQTKIKKIKVAEVAWLDNKYLVKVYDEAVYPMMKQFGDELGYRELERGWKGANIEREPPNQQPKRKMKETVSKNLEPRYEQLSDQKEVEHGRGDADLQ